MTIMIIIVAVAAAAATTTMTKITRITIKQQGNLNETIDSVSAARTDRQTDRQSTIHPQYHSRQENNNNNNNNNDNPRHKLYTGVVAYLEVGKDVQSIYREDSSAVFQEGD